MCCYYAKRHWPILVGVLAAYLVCDVYLRYESYPLRVALFVALIGGSVLYNFLFYQRAKQRAAYGGPQRAGLPPGPLPDEWDAAGDERGRYGGGAWPGQACDFAGGPPLLPACAEYHRSQRDDAALDRVIGLEKAKEALRDAFSLAVGSTEEGVRMRAYGVKPPRGILLYGPPGTGKTSFARAAAKTFGCGIIVVNASSVAGGVVGETGENIRRIFHFARAVAPCVIFWDEIDAVAKKRGTAGVNSPSDLAIETILTQMDGFACSEGVLVIAATNRLDQLDDALLRPGRFDVQIEVGLPDREARERLFGLFLGGRPHDLTPADLRALARDTEGLSPAEIEAAVNEAARKAAKDAVLISAARVREALREQAGKGRQVAVRPIEEIWAEIDSLTGLAPVKEFLREVEGAVKADAARREKGLLPLKQSLHMCFLGNPGTGKTTVARLVGELLAALGALPSGHLVETDRSGLVAAYIGQTAQKVQEIVKKAMGGVLFVDEAYSLARGGPQDYGREALDTLIKAMEDHRDKMVVILAGYTAEMQSLFGLNPGLESRIAYTCEFPDYSPAELLEIARLEARKRGFSLAPGAERDLLDHFARVDTGGAGNGRYARKLVEAAVRRAAVAGRDAEIAAEDLADLAV